MTRARGALGHETRLRALRALGRVPVDRDDACGESCGEQGEVRWASPKRKSTSAVRTQRAGTAASARGRVRGCGGAFECVCVRVSCVGEGAQSPSLSVPCAGDSVSISVTMGGSLPDDVSTSPIGCDLDGLLIVKTWRWSGPDAGFGGRHLSSACESGNLPGAGGTMAVREESARGVDTDARLAGKASGRRVHHLRYPVLHRIGRSGRRGGCVVKGVAGAGGIGLAHLCAAVSHRCPSERR